VTYSIVAVCSETGQIGSAVQTHQFGVGRIVPWVEAGVGVVATQAQANTALGPEGLGRLRAGESPADALAAMLAADEGAAHRQVGVVDVSGRAAAHTGDRCIAAASHVVGDGFTTHANMMLEPGVAEEMAAVFVQSSGPLWERLLAALDAAERLGGDIRGRQSAALVVASAEPGGPLWRERPVDVRVDDHPDPLAELRRLVALNEAYSAMSNTADAFVSGDVDAGFAVLDRIRRDHPSSREFAFWHAIRLAAHDRHDDARTALEVAFDGESGDRWRELLRRLPATGMIDDAVADSLLD
jgi:uncharacterized Ntn-hydrolase superfamily protein